MKHIQKKFLYEDNLKELKLEDHPYYDVLNITEVTPELLKNNQSPHVVLQDEFGLNVFAFVHNLNGVHVTIPLPDFTLVYYNSAYDLNVARAKVLKELGSALRDYCNLTESKSQMLYQLFGTTTSCLINLFTSIESFINSLIPANAEYRVTQKNRTEIYNLEQIQQLTFYDKLKNVVPYFHDNKSFFNKPSVHTDSIEQLKELRDSIIHTKSSGLGQTQIDLFKKLLKFNYQKAFVAVRVLFNFYKENYIVDCPCLSDH